MPIRKVAVVMGSESDLDTMQLTIDMLKKFGISYEVQVLSAHRAPEALDKFVAGTEREGIVVFIAAAGKAAHLAGVIAAKTALPVIGCPMETGMLPRMLFRFTMLGQDGKIRENEDTIFSCLLCRMCEVNCPAEVPIAENVRLLRGYFDVHVFDLAR